VKQQWGIWPNRMWPKKGEGKMSIQIIDGRMHVAGGSMQCWVVAA
jgi:hypothetical protein